MSSSVENRALGVCVGDSSLRINIEWKSELTRGWRPCAS